jgi:hypothetical protein
MTRDMKQTAEESLDSAQVVASRARYLTVVYGVTLSFIRFVDRAAIGQAAPVPLVSFAGCSWIRLRLPRINKDISHKKHKRETAPFCA